MAAQRFRITIPIFATIEINGKGATTHVPQGDVVTLEDGPQSGARLVDVDWHGVTATMLVADLLEHATMVIGAASYRVALERATDEKTSEAD